MREVRPAVLTPSDALLAALELRVGLRVLIVGNHDGCADQLRAHSTEVIVLDVQAPLADLIEYGPYDRIVVTEPVHSVAWAWVQNTRRGGLIACEFNPSGAAGQPVLLRRGDTAARGRFLATVAATPDFAPEPVPRTEIGADTRHARTSLPLHRWACPVPWFLATLTMPDGLAIARLDHPAGIRLQTREGSWCEVTGTPGDTYCCVVEGGPVSLWKRFADAHRTWQEAGEPGWDRFGLTVTADEHTVWLDGTNQRWRLPE